MLMNCKESQIDIDQMETGKKQLKMIARTLCKEGLIFSWAGRDWVMMITVQLISS